MPELLTLEEGVSAVRLARSAVEKFVKEKKKVKAENLSKSFDEKRGVFVTLKKGGDLRGCIGYPYPIATLKDAIIDSAISAAVHDPRFEPVEKDELGGINIEVTVLTPPVRLKAKPEDMPKKVEIGKHGLIVKRGLYSGLLLPQVATEHGMDAEEFLSQTCMKAGLMPDAWLEDGTEMYTFEGQIFAEDKPGG
jgi:hypothetical protein